MLLNVISEVGSELTFRNIRVFFYYKTPFSFFSLTADFPPHFIFNTSSQYIEKIPDEVQLGNRNLLFEILCMGV